MSGAGVILRAEPTIASAIVARLALNARVELLSPVADSPYCEVATGVPGAASARGYTACRYLATTPLAVDKIVTPLLPDGQPNPSYDPVRAFWLAPSWARLEAYGAQLGESLKARTGTPADRPAPPERPADAELDRMKAHLAKGIYGSGAGAAAAAGTTSRRPRPPRDAVAARAVVRACSRSATRRSIPPKAVPARLAGLVERARVARDPAVAVPDTPPSWRRRESRSRT